MTELAIGPNTPGYAPPEQFRNFKKNIDIRTDLFSIGVTAYQWFKAILPTIQY